MFKSLLLLLLPSLCSANVDLACVCSIKDAECHRLDRHILQGNSWEGVEWRFGEDCLFLLKESEIDRRFLIPHVLDVNIDSGGLKVDTVVGSVSAGKDGVGVDTIVGGASIGKDGVSANIDTPLGGASTSIGTDGHVSASANVDVPMVASLNGNIDVDHGKVSGGGGGSVTVDGVEVGGHVNVDKNGGVSGGASVGLNLGPLAHASVGVDVDSSGHVSTGVDGHAGIGPLSVDGHVAVDQSGHVDSSLTAGADIGPLGGVDATLNAGTDGVSASANANLHAGGASLSGSVNAGTGGVSGSASGSLTTGIGSLSGQVSGSSSGGVSGSVGGSATVAGQTVSGNLQGGSGSSTTGGLNVGSPSASSTSGSSPSSSSGSNGDPLAFLSTVSNTMQQGPNGFMQMLQNLQSGASSSISTPTSFNPMTFNQQVGAEAFLQQMAKIG
uniref:Uncharacterized transmembrane protein DDB_G0289901-like isoform X1 n=1 Tax=Crassostrea virginica TaxID=6565 RepID=A0A8B8AMC1_CRAVI|nr:uncharacterized transmembrane protein DDB_G0289901-like isoform X1 [Crassostrea virginica]XP_022291776.1 uncharacterized transmembrane protein DDB_G0289901-like isoform X2 [Crassostrea virginica]